MKVDFVTSSLNKDRVVVAVEGTSAEVIAFIDWLDMVEIDNTTYSEFFTGLEVKEESEFTTWWCHLDDPDHDKRILIKLRWK